MDMERDRYIDVVKGIGIFSIVIGHASWEIDIGNLTLKIGVFVYLYHLAIFLFCSGYLYNEKYTNIWEYVAKKLRGLYFPFIIYNLLYLFTRSFFISIGIVDGKKFSVGDIVISISNVLTFNGLGELMGAFWFVPMLFFSIIIFASIRVITKFFYNDYIRELVRIIGYCMVGAVGLFATDRQFGLLCNMQISFLLLPVIAFGFYFGKYNGKKFINLLGFFISLFVMVFIIKSNIGIIELSKNMIINKFLFYPITCFGIYFCLAVAKYISKLLILEKIFSYIGRYSFDIMALHFLGFKLVDLLVCTLRGQQDIMSVFPHTYTELWPIYYIVGIVFPIVVKNIFIKSKEMILKLYRQKYVKE